MSTVKEAIDLLNGQLHPSGFHAAMHSMDLLPDELANSNTAHDLMKQTYDWRYGEPDKEEYTVTLSAENMRYIGNAIEIYNSIMFDLHIKEHLKTIIKAMTDGQGEVDGDV